MILPIVPKGLAVFRAKQKLVAFLYGAVLSGLPHVTSEENRLNFR